MYLDEIRDMMYKQIDELYMEACIIQELWMRKVAERELSRKNDPARKTEETNYEFRLEFNGTSFRCRWMNIKFVRNGNKLIRVVKSLAVPEGGKYKMSQFKKADRWELEIIEQMEEPLARIRNTTKHLMKALVSLQYAAKAKGKKLKPIPIKERVTPTTHSIKKFKSQLI